MYRGSSDSVSASLRPRARLLRTIGDELISSETVALMELVKNSYDADASFVLVRFVAPMEEGHGQIEVIDDGNGMSLQTIQESWMEPATLTKKKNRRSPRFHRRFLGNKGVGRFAASRLADYLEIVTRSRDSESEVRAIFDWKQFDDDDKYLDQIEVLWDETEPDEISSGSVIANSDIFLQEALCFKDGHGTILRMTELRTSWKHKDIEILKTELSRLISPFLKFGESNFSIYLIFPEKFSHMSGKVEPPDSLDNPHYKIYGKIESDGSCNLKLEMPKYTEEVQDIHKLLVDDENLPECGPFEIELRVWDRDQDSLVEAARERQSTIREIRRDLDTAAGVNIYRDGFRVLPYGEPKNDWLRLDLRRVNNPTMRVSNNQIVGFILISADENPKLQDQSNREGLIESKAFDDLQGLVRKILVELEAPRYAIRRPKTNEGLGSDLQSEENINDTSPASNSLFGKISLSPIRSAIQDRYSEDKEIISLLESQEKEIERSVNVVKETLSRYQRLATLGQLVDTILHDGRTPLFKIGSEAELSIKKIDSLEISKEEDVFSWLRKSFSTIKDQAILIGTLFKKIEPFGGRKRGRPKVLILEKIIIETFSLLSTEIGKLNVSVRLPETETKVTVEQSEIQQVILNLLENSLFWLKGVPKNKREICVLISRVNPSSVEIIFSDSGPGVSEEYRDKIFDPYFSLKQDGVGLGLTISGEIIYSYYSGSLELLEDGPLAGATFRIILNRRV